MITRIITVQSDKPTTSVAIMCKCPNCGEAVYATYNYDKPNDYDEIRARCKCDTKLYFTFK